LGFRVWGVGFGVRHLFDESLYSLLNIRGPARQKSLQVNNWRQKSLHVNTWRHRKHDLQNNDKNSVRERESEQECVTPPCT